MNTTLLLRNIIEDFSKPEVWVQILVVVILLVALDIFFLRTLKRIFPKFVLVSLTGLIIVAGFFQLDYLLFVGAMLYLLSAFSFVFGNISEFRWLIANSSAQRRAANNNTRKFRKIYDQEEIIHQISIAVSSLSKTKTGALITIERDIPLTEALKNGTPINAPVTAPLLTTIFYKGTALHDGAVVVRDNNIIAASVYFTPSTKPMTGKVGSRHRAALGISEISDTVTIVVSEETGRVSIAYKGTLQPVSLEDFQKVVGEYLLMQ